MFHSGGLRCISRYLYVYLKWFDRFYANKPRRYENRSMPIVNMRTVAEPFDLDLGMARDPGGFFFETMIS